MTEQDKRPVPTRWVFRESFNPDGRPKGSKNRKTILREIAHQQYQVTQNGIKRKMSLLQIVVMSLCKKAMEGPGSQAAKEYERLMDQYDPEATHENAGYIVVPAYISPEDWIARELEKNKTRKPPPGVDDIDDDEVGWNNNR